jgi:pimeloyl-ACP methyl ester carboxylesterase
MPWLKRDNVALFHQEASGGDPPLVLVHGWGCNHAFMSNQLAAFQGHHRVIAVDLRGHGKSDKPRQEYTIPAFADDLAWVCRELTLKRPVIIGHSMGGAIALELAAGHAKLISGIALLDSAVLPAPHIWNRAQTLLADLRKPSYLDVLRQFIADAFFLPTDDPQRKAWAISAMLETPQHVLASAFEKIFEWDSAVAVGRCKVPTLYIAATRPRADVARFSQLCPTSVHGQVVRSGHFVQLEVPEQVDAMIRTFLRNCLTPSPDGADVP